MVRGTEVLIFVEFKLRCCMRRWPLIVARDFGNYFLMRDYVTPVQYEKWLRLMACRKVDERGLKAHQWRKAASSPFVFAYLMAPLARWC